MQPNLSLALGPLEKAVFLERPNRFLIRAQLENGDGIVAVHLPDPGRLKELLVPGAPLYLRRANRPHRKTEWSAVLVETSNRILVSLQSTLVNDLVAKAIRNKVLEELRSWDFVRSEFSIANSRWDFLLENDKQEKLILEVKSVSLVKGGLALFPDAVTKRGQKHLRELASLQEGGNFQTAVLFVVQRSDAVKISPADAIDPVFGQLLRLAHQKRVKIFGRGCLITPEFVCLEKALPIDLSERG